MTTNHAISAHAITAHPFTLVDPTYLDPTAAATSTGVDPFGVVRRAFARAQAHLAQQRLDLAERKHRVRTERLLHSDHRMRAEFHAQYRC